MSISRYYCLGMTPLHIASDKGHAKIVSMLIAKEGIDINQADKDGIYAMQVVVCCMYIMLLAKEGIDINQASKDGWTPLSVQVMQKIIDAAGKGRNRINQEQRRYLHH